MKKSILFIVAILFGLPAMFAQAYDVIFEYGEYQCRDKIF